MGDWEAYVTMWADPRVTAYIGGSPRPRDVAWPKFGQAVAMWSLFGFGNWSVLDGATGTFLGICGFAVYERGIAELEGFPEAGWAFAAHSWGRGVAREAIGAIHDWADAAAIGETRCLIDDDNVASIKVARSVGYVALADLGNARRVFRRPGASVPDRG